jgi:translation elongation factor EF-Ts
MGGIMNGTVVSYMHHDKRGGAMVEVFTETDFAANSEIVNAFGKYVAMIAYGFNLQSWEYLLEQDSKLKIGANQRLEDLKKEVKEDVRVGRISILKVL